MMTGLANSKILGTCLQMCSEKETKLRVKNKIIHPLEKSLGKNIGKEYVLIKSFSRSAAGNTSCCDPKEIRPPYICRRTTNYLVKNVLISDEKSRPQLRLDWTTYHFVFDRLRALRQDMIVQKCDLLGAVCDHDEIVIHTHILQVCVKFHLLANYLFSQNKQSGSSKDGPNLKATHQFDQHINFSHLLECLKMILNYYEILFPRNCDSGLEFKNTHFVKTKDTKNVINETRIDMIVVYILLNIGSYHSYKWGIELDDKLKNNHKVKRALRMNRLYVERNYVGLFKEVKNLSLIHLLAFHWSLPSIFKEMLAVMSAAHSSKNCKFPLQHFAKILFLEEANKEELINYLKESGIKIHSASTNDMHDPKTQNKSLNDIFICFDKNSFNASASVKWQELPDIDKQLNQCDLLTMLLDYDLNC